MQGEVRRGVVVLAAQLVAEAESWGEASVPYVIMLGPCDCTPARFTDNRWYCT